MVCLEMSIYYKNESENTWTRFISFVKGVFTKLYESKTYIIIDGDKGFTAPLKTKIPNVNRFLAHSTKNITT